MTNGPARYWIGTLYEWTPPESPTQPCIWLKGQAETCPTTGRRHHQVIAGFSRAVRLAQVKSLVGSGHWEKTRSQAAEEYVWKEATSVEGTRFEIGRKSFRRNSSTDWDAVLEQAKRGEFDAIPSDVQIRYYRTLRTITADFEKPTGIVKTVHVFYGATGTGKSKRAWEEAGASAYAKDPRTKWWDGYQGEENVIIDEFRGAIDVSHILRWLDRYPVRVERKGSSVALRAVTFWITSNLAPSCWYPELDPQTLEALNRRLTNIIEF